MLQFKLQVYWFGKKTREETYPEMSKWDEVSIFNEEEELDNRLLYEKKKKKKTLNF